MGSAVRISLGQSVHFLIGNLVLRLTVAAPTVIGFVVISKRWPISHVAHPNHPGATKSASVITPLALGFRSRCASLLP